MTCSEFIAHLDEMIEGSLPSETRLFLEEHLKGCEHCEVTLNTTKMTIKIFQEHEVYELPASVRERLHAAIIARCKNGC